MLYRLDRMLFGLPVSAWISSNRILGQYYSVSESKTQNSSSMLYWLITGRKLEDYTHADRSYLIRSRYTSNNNRGIGRKGKGKKLSPMSFI